MTATCDHIKGKLRSKKSIQPSFDEWNVWHQTEFHKGDDTRVPWREAPELAEDVYTTAEGVVVGTLLISLLNHADRVRMAAMAQLVNVMRRSLPKRVERAWRQTTFYPFADVAANARGRALRIDIQSPKHATTKYGEVDSVVAAATHNAETGDLTLFVVHRSTDMSATLEIELAGGLRGYQPVEHRVLQTDDPSAKKTAEKSTGIHPLQCRN